MIEKVRKYLVENIAYVVVFSLAGIYMIIKKGSSYTLNYVSILLGLFIPLFVVLNLFNIIKSVIIKEKMDFKELIVCLLLLLVTLVVYMFGLEQNQRIVLGLINGLSGVLLVIIMSFLTYRKR